MELYEKLDVILAVFWQDLESTPFKGIRMGNIAKKAHIPHSTFYAILQYGGKKALVRYFFTRAARIEAALADTAGQSLPRCPGIIVLTYNSAYLEKNRVNIQRMVADKDFFDFITLDARDVCRNLMADYEKILEPHDYERWKPLLINQLSGELAAFHAWLGDGMPGSIVDNVFRRNRDIGKNRGGSHVLEVVAA